MFLKPFMSPNSPHRRSFVKYSVVNFDSPAMPSKGVQPKQPKARVVRLRRKLEPQVHEDAKSVLVIKGRKTSQDVSDALKDLVRGYGVWSLHDHTRLTNTRFFASMDSDFYYESILGDVRQMIS